LDTLKPLEEKKVQFPKPLPYIVLACAVLMSSDVTMAGVFVRGVPTCGEWSEAREPAEEGLVQNEGMRTWLLGFLSGLAIGQNREFWGKSDSKALDNESAYRWVDNYCRKNPAKGLDDAGAMLFIERTRGR